MLTRYQKSLKYAILTLSLGVLAVAILTASQAPPQGSSVPQVAPVPQSSYVPTEVQSLRIKLAYKDAQIAQYELQRAQEAANKTMTALNDEVSKVRKENGWGEDVGFNFQTQQFVPPPVKPREPEKKP